MYYLYVIIITTVVFFILSLIIKNSKIFDDEDLNTHYVPSRPKPKPRPKPKRSIGRERSEKAFDTSFKKKDTTKSKFKANRVNFYQLSNSLMSKTERSFYRILCDKYSKDYFIFSKVRVADVLTPVKGMSRSDWQKAFNSISSKHFDFVFCEKEKISFECVVELDDSSHKHQKEND